MATGVVTKKSAHSNDEKPQERPKCLKWIVVLQKFGEEVRIQPDWRNAMEIGDTVRFISPDGNVEVEFEPDTGDHLPLGARTFRDGTENHKIVCSSKGVMQCTIITPDKVKYGYARREAAAKALRDAGETVPDDNQGSRYCTGTGCP
jgi:hypothetical protein